MTEAAHSLDFDRIRDDMVERQIRTWEVLDQGVLDIMKSTPRENFVPRNLRALACADMNLPIGEGEVMLQPKVEGRILQSLAITRNDSILEIGTGTGYFTSLLAQLGGRVHSVDIREAFTRDADANLKALGIGNVTLETRDAATLEGFGEDYDVIVVTGSMPALHDSFLQRLKLNGRLFVVIGAGPVMEAQLRTRVGNDDWAIASLFDTAVPPLVNAWNPQHFPF